ncbi:MAG TPA: hypothetical protein P5123_03800 [Spirochaetota bacterium]|nr:hypothetical protein [Spirochaetota bacterium]
MEYSLSDGTRPRFLVIKYILRVMAPYIFLLFFLIAINFGFNIYSSWGGVNLVVKLYIYTFAFFLVYTISISLPPELRSAYSRYGLLTKFIYVLESRIFPFALIYIVTAIYSVVENMGSQYWPYDSFAGIFDDAISNLVIYSVVLMYVLKIKKRPYVTVPVYLFLIYLYYMINQRFYQNFYAGNAMVAFKILKAALLFFLMTWSTKLKASRFFLNLCFSLLLAIALNALIIGIYKLSYNNVSNRVLKNSIALKLTKFGRPSALSPLMKDVLDKKDITLLDQIYPYVKYYGKNFDISEIQWREFLFHDDVSFANRVASYMLKEGVSAHPAEIIDFVKKNIKQDPDSIRNSEFLIRLTAVCLNEYGSNKELVEAMHMSDDVFLIWAIKVMGETGDCHLISEIVVYLNHIDSDISDAAYNALKLLTGIDPYAQSQIPYNSVRSLKLFNDYLHKSCK